MMDEFVDEEVFYFLWNIPRLMAWKMFLVSVNNFENKWIGLPVCRLGNHSRSMRV